jgi:cytochrome c556
MRRLVTKMIVALALAAILVAAAACASVQTPHQPSATGINKPHDVVFARRILMSGISSNMDEIIGILEAPGDFDLLGAREHAAEISTMLLAFPHLFPPATDTWSKAFEEDDAARVSFAKSEVWQTFDDFYARAQAASQTALDASLARRADQFRQLALDLQRECDGCHAQYRRY